LFVKNRKFITIDFEIQKKSGRCVQVLILIHRNSAECKVHFSIPQAPAAAINPSVVYEPLGIIEKKLVDVNIIETYADSSFISIDTACCVKIMFARWVVMQIRKHSARKIIFSTLIVIAHCV